MSGLSLVFLGTPDPAVKVLHAALAAGFSVPLAVTQPDRPRGRGRGLAPSPVKAAALAAGIPVHEPADVNAPESVERIRAAGADVLLIVAYGSILRKAVRQACRLLPLNVHFSLLPAYRGAAPVTWAIADGAAVTGVTIQRIVARLDAGPVLAAAEVPIGPEETAGELMDRLADVGADLAVRTLLAVVRGEARETPQDETRATLARMLTKEDGLVDWRLDAASLCRRVRAMTPWPGARTAFRSRARPEAVPATLLRCRPEPDAAGDGPPGTVLAVEAGGLRVQAGSGHVLVLSLKPAGKQALSPKEFANGYRAAPGDSFESLS